MYLCFNRGICRGEGLGGLRTFVKKKNTRILNKIVSTIFESKQRHENCCTVLLYSQSFKGAFASTVGWGPIAEDAVEDFVQSERSSYRTCRQLAWFNLTGQGGIQLNADDVCQMKNRADQKLILHKATEDRSI